MISLDDYSENAIYAVFILKHFGHIILYFKNSKQTSEVGSYKPPSEDDG